MASPNIWPAGIGYPTGVDTVTVSPVYTSAKIYFVSSLTGNDTTGTGVDPERPWATINKFFLSGNATGDICAVAAGHVETFTSNFSMGSNVRIVGGGVGTSRPQITNANAASAPMWDNTPAACVVENLYFPASSVASAGPRIRQEGTGSRVINCQFDCGVNDTFATGSLEYVTGAGSATIQNTVFSSVGSRPSVGLAVSNAMNDMLLDGVTFSGGSYGWTDYAFKGVAAITRLVVKNLVLSGNSDLITATATTYQIFGVTTSGASKIVLTA